MKKAWIENGKIRDFVNGDPASMFHPDVARLYDTDVPADAQNGDGWEDGQLVKPIVVEMPQQPQAPQAPQITAVSPVEFKMLFTVQERLAIKTARAADPGVDDIFGLLDDPRLTTVRLNIKGTRDSVMYLASKKLIAPERVGQILAGQQA